MIKKIGILTSGGDSPGMNAAIKAVVQAALKKNINVIGICNGYTGVIQKKFKLLNDNKVKNIMNYGGTILGSSRFPEFKQKNIQKQAIKNLHQKNINALIVIGGNGSYKGAQYLTEMGFPCVGIPGTIDNDVLGTEYTIGFQTALNTVVKSIDKLKDTSLSHQRIIIIEIMGRYCGDLALSAFFACNCDFVILPTVLFKKKILVQEILKNLKKGQKNFIILMTEHIYDIHTLSNYIQKKTNKETRAIILGHVQRGGSPVTYDRILATRMGYYSINILLKGISGVCIGIKNNYIVHQKIKNLSIHKKMSFIQKWSLKSKNLYHYTYF
ncbi:6-phosphofructokinase [Buchnera aphidicola]|uniref:ATP-dependent 6-phosphofructokinase n=1 Tax=Buchnera aphidicola subsp. Tuberolachnus salignus TaxID=98804 RepID=A0A160SY74_BUCTT|nr:6-phosphofructokinase [Buchnera aphidicola]CUR53174.1 ATP-dependent 6-phosphofructokinase isozyme 1 [Buchnera aphidicola (Tuberolachnus salignus)]